MTERLEAELDFEVDRSDITAVIGDVERLKELGAEFAEALSNVDLSQFSDFDAAALSDAADALSRLGEVDLTDAATAAETIGEAADPAEIIATALERAAEEAAAIAEGTEGIEADQAQLLAEALAGAAAAAQEVAAGGEVDSQPAEALAAALGFAATESGELSAEALAATEALILAAVSGEGLTDELGEAAQRAAEAADAAGDLGKRTDETRTSADGLSDSTDNLATSLFSGAALADEIGEGFREIASNAEGTLGPLQRGIDLLGGWESLLTGANAALGGLVLGEAVFTAVGLQFNELTNIITAKTGATGDALREASGEFSEVLRGSDEDAGLLASTLGDLRRDMDLTGTSLETLTVQTADFLSATGGSAGDVRSLTQLVQQFGLDAQQTARFEDELVAVQREYGGSISTLLAQVRTAGPILQTLGFDEGQIAGLAAQLDQAGVGLQRLAPRLAKFAQDTQKSGGDAGLAFRQLVDDIRNAGSDGEAASIAFDVFGQRVGPQFAAAVRSGVVSLEELDNVLATSSGAAKAKADELDDLSSVFNQMKNDVLAAIGPIGKAMGDDLADALQSASPLLRGILDLLVAVSPAFGTLGNILSIVSPAIGAFGQVISVVAQAVDAIPGPILAMASAYAFMSRVPFAAMAGGIANVASGVASFARSAPDAIQRALGLADAIGPSKLDRGFNALSGALLGINLPALAAGAALTGVTLVMAQRQQAAQEMAAKVDVLKKSLGEMSAAAQQAAPTLEQLFSQGSKGGLVSDKDIEAFAKLGLTYQQVVGIVQKDLGTEGFGLTKALREEAINAAGGFRQFVDQLDLKREDDVLRNLDKSPEIMARARQTFIEHGEILGVTEKNSKRAAEALNEVVDAEDKRAAVTLAGIQASKENGGAIIAEAAARLGITEVSEHEAAVLNEVNLLLGQQAAQRNGMGPIEDDQARRLGEITRALDEQGLTSNKLADANARRIQVEGILLGAIAAGGVADADREKAALASGLVGEDAAKRIGEAEQQLLAIRERLEPPTKAVTDAQTILFEGIDKGLPPMAALRDAQAATGVETERLAGFYEQAQAALAKFNTPLSESPAAVNAATRAMADGSVTGAEYGAVVAAVGGSWQQADAAISTAAASVERSSKLMLEMAPSIGEIQKQLITPAPGSGPRPDTRLGQFDEEAASIKALATLRDQDLASREAQVTRAIEIARRQREQGGPAVDTAALEGQLASVRTQREQLAAELGVSVESIDAAKARMGEALSTAPPGLTEIFGGLQASVDEEAALIATTIELRAQGIDDALKLAFEFPEEQRDDFIRQLAEATPEVKATLEKQAEEIIKGRDANKKASEFDLFADENTKANDNAKKRGEELASNFADGVAEGLSDAEIFELINAAVEAGVDPETARRVMKEMGRSGGEGFGEGANEGIIGSPISPEIIGGYMAPAAGEMAVQASFAATSWTGALAENVIGSPINPEVIGGYMAPAAGEMAVNATAAAASWTASANAGVIGSPVLPETIGGFITPAAAVLATSGTTHGTSYAGAASGGIAANPVPGSTAGTLVGGVGNEMGSQGSTAGGNYAAGVAQGIRSGAGQAIEEAYRLANQVDAIVGASLASASPSKKGIKRGQEYAEGIAIGIRDAGRGAIGAAEGVAASIASQRLSTELGALGVGGNSSITALADGPGFDRVVTALGRKQPVVRPRRRRPFGGK